jgi:GNAT superfamily N-acetyltransferase
MRIALAQTPDEIAACHPVMKELRTKYPLRTFAQQVQEQQTDGYLLAFVEDEGEISAAAGFRLSQNLAWGKFLYVDDLVTLPAARSKGYGGKLLDWLTGYARQHGCGELHLDSGVQRLAAHRFYLTNRMEITSHHFAMKL